MTTLAEEDTTPAAMTAAFLHEASRYYDFLAVGSMRASWEGLDSSQKEPFIGHVLSARGKSFAEYYEVMTSAFRMAGRPVPDVTDEQSALVRFARMRYSIIQCLLAGTEDGQ